MKGCDCDTGEEQSYQTALEPSCGSLAGTRPTLTECPTHHAQAVLEPFCAALAGTRRPALAARLQDGVFGELLTRTSGAAPPGVGAPLAALDLRALGGRLFDLGAPLQPL